MAIEQRFRKLARKIKKLGYKVYVVQYDGFNYGYVVNDDDQIGYFQFDNFNHGIKFTTIHLPHPKFGTGFSVRKSYAFEGYVEFTREIVNLSFAHHPMWVRSDTSSIKKVTATEYLKNHFRKRNLKKL